MFLNSTVLFAFSTDMYFSHVPCILSAFTNMPSLGRQWFSSAWFYWCFPSVQKGAQYSRHSLNIDWKQMRMRDSKCISTQFNPWRHSQDLPFQLQPRKESGALRKAYDFPTIHTVRLKSSVQSYVGQQFLTDVSHSQTVNLVFFFWYCIPFHWFRNRQNISGNVLW